MVAPDMRHSRRSQAEIPLIGLSEFGQPPLIGAARAKEMVFSADIYDAKTLLAWGLINKVYPDVDVEAEARAYAHKLAAGPTISYRYAKALINAAVSNGVSAADLMAMEATPQTFDTEDMRNATTRFVEVGRGKFRDGLEFKGR
jgi:enoyl-CoA hydratase/carnithine racemase